MALSSRAFWRDSGTMNATNKINNTCKANAVSNGINLTFSHGNLLHTYRFSLDFTKDGPISGDAIAVTAATALRPTVLIESLSMGVTSDR